MSRGKAKTGLPISKHLRLAKELRQLEAWAESLLSHMEEAYPLHTKPVKLPAQIQAKLGELKEVMAAQFPQDVDDFKNPYGEAPDDGN